MNILIIGNAFPPTYMGGESIHIYNLVSGLLERGHQTVVVHAAPGNAGRENITVTSPKPGLDVYAIFLDEKADRYIEILNSRLTAIFESLINQGHHFDLVHCHSNRFSWAVRDLVRRYSIPLVTTIHAIHIPMVHHLITSKNMNRDLHDLDIYREDTLRTKSLCAESGRIIGISNAMVGHITRYYQPDPEKIRLVYNGIDTERLNRSEIESINNIKSRYSLEDKRVILFSGRMEPVKGIVPYTVACKEIEKRYRDVAFMFLGNGSSDPWLRAQFLGHKNVHFIDWLPFREVIPYYHLADIVAVPSLIEPFGLVAVEAMACRTCVVASNADGLDEIIINDLNGIKIPLITDRFEDRNIRAEDIFLALEMALIDPECRKSMAEQAVLRAGDFSLGRMIDDMEKVYADLIPSPEKSRHS